MNFYLKIQLYGYRIGSLPKERILTQEEDLDFFLELQKENAGNNQQLEEDDDQSLKKRKT
ncbi:MAG: hypothetical protein WKG06_16620 [Segetibacter sp.]